MTDEEAAAIAERVSKATPGPWEHTNSIIHASAELIAQPYAQGGRFNENAAFIAHAREDIPALLAERAAWRAIGRVVATARCPTYEDGDIICPFCHCWPSHCPDCPSSKARALLAGENATDAVDATESGERDEPTPPVVYRASEDAEWRIVTACEQCGAVIRAEGVAERGLLLSVPIHCERCGEQRLVEIHVA